MVKFDYKVNKGNNQKDPSLACDRIFVKQAG
jgi:hypothetical protein